MGISECNAGVGVEILPVIHASGTGISSAMMGHLARMQT